MTRSGLWSLAALLAFGGTAGCECVAGITDRHVGSAGGGGASSSLTAGGGGAATSTTSGTGAAGGGGHAAGGSGGGGSAIGGAWPDSPTVFCSDTVVEVDPCPGQTDTAFGQDGNHREHVPAYVHGLDDMVEDGVTQLVWSGHTRSAGNSNIGPTCAGVDDGGHNDWRAPTVLELSSLFDFGRAGGAIDPTAITGSVSFVWSTDTFQEDALKAWIVDFDAGAVLPRAKSTAGGSALCVRGGLPTGGLVRVDANLWADPKTGLTWETKTPKSESRSWPEALAWCAQLTVGGHQDFRLPSAKEALTLMDRTVAPPYIVPELGPFTTIQVYWTSTPKTDDPTFARSIVYYTGYLSQGAMDNIYNLRCVRDSGP